MSAFDRADKLCVHRNVLPLDCKYGIESPRGRRRPADWDQWNNNAGVKVRQQIGLAVQDESVPQVVNLELRHSEQSIFLKGKTVGLYPRI